MTLGYAGRAWIEIEDECVAIYSYSGENWNIRDKSERARIESIEGSFIINKSRLVEPIVRSKKKQMPNGKKKIVEKKILVRPDISEAIDERDIVIDKLCGVDAEQESYKPCVYRHLLHRIFEQYQIDGTLPKLVAFVM